MNVLPYGDRAVLLEPADPATVLTVRDWLVAQGYPGVVAVVPAARTVLVEVDPALLPVIRLRELLAGAEPVPPADTVTGELLELPVRYDGADLAGGRRTPRDRHRGTHRVCTARPNTPSGSADSPPASAI